MRLARLVRIAAAIVAAAAVVIVGVLMSMDFGAYKDEITAAVRDATGRRLVVQGDLKLGIGFSPVLKADGVRLANAKWGSRRQMLTARRLEVEIALLPLIAGKLRIKRLILVEPDILLETDAKGRGNWVFAPGGGNESGSGDDLASAVSRLRTVLVRNGKLTFRDGRSGKRTVLSLNRLEASAPPDQPFRFDVAGALDKARFRLRGVTGPLSELSRTATAWPVDLTAEFGGATATVKGAIANPAETKGVDLGLRVDGENLAALGRALKSAGLPRGRYRLSGRLTDIDGGWAVTRIRVTLAGSKLSGAAKVLTGGKVSRIRVNLESRLIDLGAIRWTEAPSGRAARPARIFSSAPLPFEAFSRLDAEVRLRLERVRIAGLEARGLDMVITARRGVLSLNIPKGRLAGGTVFAAARLGRKASRARLVVRRARLGDVLSAFGAAGMVETMGDFTLDVKGAGRSIRAIVSGLNGRIELTAGKGRVFSRPIRLLGADLLNSIAPWAEAEDDTALNCVVARFQIRKGIARTRGLLLDTATVTIAGEGSVDLRKETIDLTLTPRPKEKRLLNLAIAIDVTGPLADPGIAPNTLGVVKGVAGAVAGTVIGPIGLLVPLVSLGSDDKNPCIAALSTSPAARSRNSGGAPSIQKTLENIGEGITKGLQGLFGR